VIYHVPPRSLHLPRDIAAHDGTCGDDAFCRLLLQPQAQSQTSSTTLATTSRVQISPILRKIVPPEGRDFEP
jgi:hypothetical protein